MSTIGRRGLLGLGLGLAAGGCVPVGGGLRPDEVAAQLRPTVDAPPPPGLGPRLVHDMAELSPAEVAQLLGEGRVPGVAVVDQPEAYAVRLPGSYVVLNVDGLLIGRVVVMGASPPPPRGADWLA